MAWAAFAAWGLVEHVPELERLGLMSLDGTTDGINSAGARGACTRCSFGKEMVEVVTTPHPRALQALEAAGYHIELDPAASRRRKPSMVLMFSSCGWTRRDACRVRPS